MRLLAGKVKRNNLANLHKLLLQLNLLHQLSLLQTRSSAQKVCSFSDFIAYNQLFQRNSAVEVGKALPYVLSWHSKGKPLKLYTFRLKFQIDRYVIHTSRYVVSRRSDNSRWSAARSKV